MPGTRKLGRTSDSRNAMTVSYTHLEPYKGKGIRYAGEVVKHKEGKAGKGKK